ncbi:hypothetical protein G3I01_05890 [Gramella sp. MT6]|uniref:hypothetical protein n=1 Tax=Gramella sp. MT6 TaxID=2705471 RepID=UPI001C5E7BEC|nr:hypothetical protein [Gramella sp. MT6]QYA25058.1 hypothetical protein G3I01_05890 [Gramella sp. MT6]
MRILYKILFLFFLFISCSTEDEHIINKQSEPETKLFKTEDYQEYILLQVGQRQVLFSDGMKNYKDESLGSKLVENYDYAGNRFYTLNLWGVIEDNDTKQVRRLGITIRHFYGEGLYETGQQLNNNCNFFDLGTAWYSHYAEKGEGYLEITSVNEEYIKGSLDLMVHNSNDKDQYKKILGEFKLLLE